MEPSFLLAEMELATSVWALRKLLSRSGSASPPLEGSRQFGLAWMSPKRVERLWEGKGWPVTIYCNSLGIDDKILNQQYVWDGEEDQSWKKF